MLTPKLHSGTSKTEAGQGGLVRVALFWKSHLAILYHATGFCLFCMLSNKAIFERRLTAITAVEAIGCKGNIKLSSFLIQITSTAWLAPQVITRLFEQTKVITLVKQHCFKLVISFQLLQVGSN